MSLAQKYRARFVAQRGSLTIYLAVAAAFHGGMIAGGVVSWQQTEPPNLAIEPIQPIEFVYLETEEADSESDRRSNLDAIAGGESQPDLPIATGKPGIEESLRENSATDNKAIEPLVSSFVPPGRIVPASSAVQDDRTKAAQTQANVKPEVAAPPQITPEPSPSSDSTEIDTPSAAPADVSDSAFAELPQLEPELFSPDSLLMDSDFSAAEQGVPSESAPLEQSIPSESLPPATEPFAPPVEAALSLGREFAGIANSNRTAANELGVDAEQDPIWGEYLAQMNQQIEQQWQRIQVEVDVTRSVKVRFTVSQPGELVELEVTQPSGLAIADEAAVQAIQQSAPFGALPSTANQQQLTRTLTFHYRVRQPAPPQ